MEVNGMTMEVKIKVASELKWDVIDTIQLKIVATDLNTEKNLKSSNSTQNKK